MSNNFNPYAPFNNTPEHKNRLEKIANRPSQRQRDLLKPGRVTIIDYGTSGEGPRVAVKAK
jgi:hypothetical protein